MLNKKDPTLGRRVADAIVAANSAVIDCLLQCSLQKDIRGAHYLSMCPDVMTMLFGIKSSSVNPNIYGGHWALFKPRISSASILQTLADRNFCTAEIEKVMLHELPLAATMPPLNPHVASKISQANKLVYEAYVTCSEQKDPVSLMLLGTGTKTDYIDAFAQISKAKMLAAFSAANLPIFSLRHNSGEVMKSICEHGFTQPLVIREMLKDAAFA